MNFKNISKFIASILLGECLFISNFHEVYAAGDVVALKQSVDMNLRNLYRVKIRLERTPEQEFSSNLFNDEGRNST